MSTWLPDPTGPSRERRDRADELASLERLLALCEVQAVRSGVPFPLGARPQGDGVNFAISSRHGTGVRPDLFANGAHNRDGTDENYSANHGVEGDADDPALDALRARQIKNFLLTLAISRGVPMLLGGDEFRRTQRGNNNAYCQDNDTSWVDWSLRQRHDELVRFTRNVLALRRGHPVLRRGVFYSEEEVRWFDRGGRTPDWGDDSQKSLACLIRAEGDADLYLMFNADTEPTPFILPPLARPRHWHLAVDTGQPAPRDACAVGDEHPLQDGTRYELAARSSAVLVARLPAAIA